MNEFTGGAKMKPSYIKQIYKSFQKVDVNNTGALEYHEFLEVMERVDTPLMQQMFQAFDLDDSGTVELKEFHRCTVEIYIGEQDRQIEILLYDV